MWMWFTRLIGRRSSQAKNKARATPSTSFYSLTATLNDGTILNFADLQGRKVLLVNTASDCGYTNQYETLQELHEKFGNKVKVIGFPSNDFKEQEKGSDEEIAVFCRKNYGVTFHLAKKTSVVKGDGQSTVFQWLSDKKLNGWNDKQPGWNFSKYLVSEDGVLLNYFDPGISPMSAEVINAINN